MHVRMAPLTHILLMYSDISAQKSSTNSFSRWRANTLISSSGSLRRERIPAGGKRRKGEGGGGRRGGGKRAVMEGGSERRERVRDVWSVNLG